MHANNKVSSRPVIILAAVPALVTTGLKAIGFEGRDVKPLTRTVDGETKSESLIISGGLSNENLEELAGHCKTEDYISLDAYRVATLRKADGSFVDVLGTLKTGEKGGVNGHYADENDVFAILK